MESSIRRFGPLLLAGVLGGVVALALQAGFGALLPTAAAAGVTVIRAQRFEVTDPSGAVVALLGVGADGRPGLEMRNSSGVVRARFGLDAAVNDRPSLVLNGASGRPRLWLIEGPTGNPSLMLDDSDGKTRAALSVMDTAPSLRLDGQGGTAVLSSSSDGMPGWVLDGAPGLMLNDGKNTAVIGPKGLLKP